MAIFCGYSTLLLLHSAHAHYKLITKSAIRAHVYSISTLFYKRKRKL